MLLKMYGIFKWCNGNLQKLWCKHKKNIEIGKSASLLSIIMSILDSRRDRESNGLIVCIFFQLFLFWWSKFGTATKILVRFITNLLLMPHRKLVWTKFQFNTHGTLIGSLGLGSDTLADPTNWPVLMPEWYLPTLKEFCKFRL